MSVRGGTIGALCVVALLLGLPVLAGVYSVRDPTYSCIVDVLPAAGVGFDQAYPIVGTITRFPLGVQCSFTATDGEMVVRRADWISTGMAGVSVLSLLGAGVVAVGLRRRRPSSH
ncbi:hypothetical protein [Cryobacterium psychrophilum]|uniref:Uncharacterized protein n=1 Tax=Cryobacterium psychrophilum TaxID=41988 RepID=A0A4Y8KRJ4_9MICO|nr:hypothetical protein [Cryobacterium psychrophilum]TDW29775.1 hypothetical protein EDD25_1485 [Cryobacterium psychrophilum]TFD81873.1 hypothetical protein E3T53_02485 [Cryobacterium psychrophilum]